MEESLTGECELNTIIRENERKKISQHKKMDNGKSKHIHASQREREKKCVLWMFSMLVNVLDIFRQAPDIFEHRLNPNSSTIEIHAQTYKSLCSHEKYS